MNYEELKELKVDEYEKKLLNNQPLSRFAVYPYRKELRERLKFNDDATEYLEELIESVNETL
jgi:hypothetical protein